jgi:orotidine-5'-phosphate decarboxylase
MTRKQLTQQIQQKKSYLCVGLDTDLTKIPKHLQSHPDAVFEFNKQIIDATQDLCVAYKINTAFYEAMGLKGWEAMEKTVNYISNNHFIIADAKRGDIGNTSLQYAKAFFETMNFDAITVAPYMGEDSVKPFLEFENKWAIVLGLTSNAGSKDFEQLRLVRGDMNQGGGDEFLYETVLKKVSSWGTDENLMFVIGATKASDLEAIRKIIPDHFLLVPGVGFQGGSLMEVSKYGLNRHYGLLVNASRAIIYAGDNVDFAAEARIIAQQYQSEMATYLK